jgi:hypothetical protein
VRNLFKLPKHQSPQIRSPDYTSRALPTPFR